MSSRAIHFGDIDVCSRVDGNAIVLIVNGSTSDSETINATNIEGIGILGESISSLVVECYIADGESI